MKNAYLPILTDNTRSTFFDYIDCLDIPKIDYFAIGIQNIFTKNSLSLMSNSDWQKKFVNENYANYDPIRRATLCTERNFIPFGEIDYIDNFGKEIMRQRALFGIKNGIILMRRFLTHNYVITLGTNFSQFDEFEFLQRHYSQLKIIQADFIALIEKDVKNFFPSKFIHPGGDAK